MNISIILLLLGLLLMMLARNIPGFADWYRLHIYRKQADFWGGLYGYLPISASECYLYALILWVLGRMIKGICAYKEKVMPGGY